MTPEVSTGTGGGTTFDVLDPATEEVVEGETVRGGEDNKEVLTEFTGTVPDDAVKNILPGAEGDFDAEEGFAICPRHAVFSALPTVMKVPLPSP